MVLEKIHKENDIKNLSPEELTMLADEIRQFLIEKISVTGGHLASNLGVVELTMALHLVFDLPQDKLIWDVVDFQKEKRANVMPLIQGIVLLLFPQDLDMWRQENFRAEPTVWFRSSETVL